jgi:hypothetical protein
MTHKLIIIFIISLPTFLVGQNDFNLNSEVGDSLWVEINGQKFSLGKEPIHIRTHYPQFDTLRFISEASNANDKIICNFKPDSSYSIAGACCASLDIIPSSKFKNDSLEIWFEDYESNFTKIQKTLLDRPKISMRIETEYKETIYGWYVDMACFPQFKGLNTEKWEYGVPQKCFYWNNISPFIFFTSTIDYESNENGIIEDVYPEYDEIEILGEIQVRLFDDDHFTLTFDPETKKVKLEYE